MAVTKGKRHPPGGGNGNGKQGGPDVALLNTLGGAFARRLGWLERAGFQYGGKRDIYTEAGYEPRGTENFALFNGLYERNEIAGRVVDLPPKTTWKIPPEIVEVGGEDETEFCKAFTALADRVRLWQHFEMVDRRAGIGRFGILYLGLRGAADDQTPVQKLSGPEDVLFLQAYDEGQTSVSSYVTNNQDERFGRPDFYQITFSAGQAGKFPKQQGRVHWSHVLHVAEDSVDGVFGRPRLKRVLNRMFDLDKITASTAEAYWQTAARILQGKIGENVTASDTLLDDLDDKLAEMAHNLRRQFVGKGVELNWMGSTPPGVRDIADLYFALIAIGCGIPRRILFGNEQGDLASSTDQATFFGLVSERQKQFAEPLILRPFIDTLITLGALPKPAKGYEVVWPELFELTELETADANYKRAQTAAALTPMGGDPTTLVEIDEERNVWLMPREPTPTPPPGEGGPGGLVPGVEGDGGEEPPGGKGGKYTWGDGDIEVEGGESATQFDVEEEDGGELADQYDPDQPRDDRGRWTSGGGGGGTTVTARAKPGERSQGAVNVERSTELGTLVGAKNKECYKNAAVGLMSAGPGARYVEGYAVSAETPFVAFGHAWIETGDGNILELTPTWRTGATYFPARRWTRGQVEHHVHQGGAEGAVFPIAGPGSKPTVGGREMEPYAAAMKAAWKHVGVDLHEMGQRQERLEHGMDLGRDNPSGEMGWGHD